MTMDNKPEQQSKSPVQEVRQRSAWKRLFGKKWLYPGIYMLAAALIVALMWWYQGWYQNKNANIDPQQMGAQEERNVDKTGLKPGDDEAVATGAKSDRMIQPATGDVAVDMKFYDDNASSEEKEATLVQYGNTFNPHTGWDFASKDNQTFEVVAALSGTVKSVATHPLNGTEVIVGHEGGLETVYQSLDDVKVEEGDRVEQGDVIGMAGRNKVEKDAGTHLHFEVREDGTPVNPENYLNQKTGDE